MSSTRCRTSSRLSLVLGIMAVLSMSAWSQSTGIDRLEAVGKFLDGKLPATTPSGGGTAQPPARLSEVGAFRHLAALTPRAGLVPYGVNSPLWTDGAAKQRWLAIPNDGVADSPGEKIVFSANDAWQFPVGSVLVKQFDLPVDDRNPTIFRRMETRFLVHGNDGVYYGVTYRWRADGSDADLLPDGDSAVVAITTVSGGVRNQTWSFPSRADCRTCHNIGAGRVLGVRTHQLNGLFTYEATGRTDNQLRTLNALGLFSTPLTEAAIPEYPASVPVTDPVAPLEHRVRSYLAANCAHCHYPGNPENPSARFDTRLGTPLAQQNIINGSVLYDLGRPGARIIAPQSLYNSMMHLRLGLNGLHQMPPIGRNTVDTAALTVLASWINALPIQPPPTTNQSPIARNDEATTLLNTPVTISVLANDSDPDNNSLAASNPTTPTAGTVTSLPANQFRYTPPNGFTGTATFVYTVLDGAGGSGNATVTILVLPPATSDSVAFFDGTSRLSAPGSYGGVAMAVADMNRDGLDDIVHLQNARQIRVEYQSPSGGAFTFRNVGTIAPTFQWGFSIGDADNNGFPDIISGGYYDGLKYYRSNSSGTGYSRTTLATPSIFAQGITFVDINRDGWLDVFACHDDAESVKFRNTGNGSLTPDASLIDTRTREASDNSGNYGVVWTDYDNDGDEDLYISKCRAGASSATDPRRINQLFRNNGNGTYTDVAPAAGVAFGEQTWVSDFGDIDNDGDMDLFVGNHGSASYLMLNEGNGTFSNVTAPAGLSGVNWRIMQSVFRDFNNDGWVDLLLTGEQQQLWISNRDRTFQLLANPFTSVIMESCAVGDLNRDGFTDIYSGYATIYNTPASSRPDKLFLCQPNGNNFLSLTLRGTASNAGGIGSRIELHGPWGVQTRDVRGGEGYCVSHSFTQLFGMGNVGAATKLRVRWPSGTIDEAGGITPNRFLTLREGSTASPALTSPGNQNHLRAAVVNIPLTASDPTGDVLTFSATALPPGVSINPATGLISGTIASSALTAYSSSVAVTDGWSTVTRAFSWTIGGPVAPAVSLTSAASTVTGPFDVSIGFTAAVSGLTASDFAITNGTAATLTGSGSQYLVRINPVAAGEVRISLPAGAATTSGGAGSLASNVLPITYSVSDTSPPGITLTTASATISGAFTVEATFSESVSGFASGDPTVTNGSAAPPAGSGSRYSIVITPAGYGTVTVRIPAGVATDAAGNANTASDTLTVTWPQPNRAPVVINPGPQTSLRGRVASLAMQGSDPDGQALTWSASGLPSGLSIAQASGVISGTIATNALTTSNVQVGASDGIVSTATAFTWTTTAPPTSPNGLRAEFFAGLTPGIAPPLLARTDPNIDFDWGSGSPGIGVPVDDFSARWSGFLTAPVTESFTFYVPSDNGVRVWINQELVLDKWTPQDIAGWHNFTLPMTGNVAVPFMVEYAELNGGANITLYWFSSTLPWEAIATARFTSAAPTNRPPVLITPASQSTVRGSIVSYQAVASDPDFNPLIWSAGGLPAGLVINAATGVISGTVPVTAAPSNSVTLTVSDGNLTTQTVFSWLTTSPPANRAPVLSNPGTQTSIRGSIVTLTPVASDPDGDALTWSATGIPAGLAINAVTGQISGTIFSNAATSYMVNVRAADPGGLASIVTFTWNTTDVPLQGLRAEYFAGMVPGAAAPLLTRTDPTIDFNWGGGSPSAAVPIDYFSARWTGLLTAPYSETYTIYAPSDNGVRIWLNNELVLDKWTPADISGWHNFTFALTAGQAIPIKVEYAELYGGANISLFWFSNTQPWAAIDPAYLNPAQVLPAGSAPSATTVVRSQRIISSTGGGTVFTFNRPSASTADLSYIVQESEDLGLWRISNRPAKVTQMQDGTDQISLTVSTPIGFETAPRSLFFRVCMVVPNPSTSTP